MVAKSKAKHSKKDESNLRIAAQEVFDAAQAALVSAEDRAFAPIAKVYLEAAQALDETEPAKEAEGVADEVAKRRVERDERVRDAQAALRAAKDSRREPSE